MSEIVKDCASFVVLSSEYFVDWQYRVEITVDDRNVSKILLENASFSLKVNVVLLFSDAKLFFVNTS